MINRAQFEYINEPGFPLDWLEYGEALRLTEQKIQESLKTAPLTIRHLTTHLARAGGKGIRAQALLACAMGSDDLIRKSAVNAAAAIELLHLATLIHDDIIDEADTRRGIAALHVKFGDKLAVLCGDYLLCFALKLVASVTSDDKTDLNKMAATLLPYFTEVCLGEVREFSNTGNLDLTEEEYLKIISGKTAALFRASFHAGFLLSDEPQEMEDAYVDIGEQIGMIFQLADDCMDFTSSLKKAKKPVLNDCSRGVVTLPLIHALKEDKGLKEKMLNGASEDDIRAAVIKTGGIEYLRSMVADRKMKAKELISMLGSEKKRGRLGLLLEKAASL
ncbi:MAG: polyprenyl synthetase family protein [Clostridia bacterium]|nr:polyprenyl synthetase family protein [Clostridia bacterium]